MENNPEDVHDLWNEPDYAEVKRMLCAHLLAELIDGESGIPRRIWRSGAWAVHRAVQQMEAQPDARAALSQRFGDKN